MAQNYYVTPSPQPNRFSKKNLLVGGGLVTAVIIALLLLGSGGNTMSKQLQHLSLRMASLQKLLESAEVSKNLRDEELSHINTELKLTLASSVNELTPLMVDAGLPSQFDKSIVASESDASVAVKLEEAALNNKFDEAYAETLGQKIISLRALIKETYSLSKNTKLRQALVNLDNTLRNSHQSLDKLNY